MKIRIFLLALCCLNLSSSLLAQWRYQLGFTAGVNVASLRSDLFSTASVRIAPLVGCSFAVGLGDDRFELNQEIVLAFKGAQARAVYFRPEEKPDEHTYGYHYNSFETAVFAGVRPGREVPIYLQAGGFFGANFHTLDRSRRELMIADYHSINNALRAVDLNDAFSGIDYGPVVGLTAGEGHFRATARYYHGLHNLYNALDFVPSGHRIFTNSLRLTLTYFLF